MADPLTLTHWGAYHPRVEDGKLVAMDPLAEDPAPSPIGNSLPDALTHAARITQPMVRADFLERGADARARRGDGPFVPVSWDFALDLSARELERVRRDHGNRAIFGGSYGWSSAGRFHHAQGQLHRFLNMAGGYTRSVNTHSHAAAEVLLPHIIGNHDGMEGRHTPWELIRGHTTLFVTFGGIPERNTQVSSGGVGHHRVPDWLHKCHASGMKFVNISPLRSDLAPTLDAEWLPVRPNSDTAMMLALAHTLVDEGLENREFLDRYTTGFEQFVPYLKGRADGQPKSADWAAPLCRIAADTIRELARRMARERTMISVAWSLQRASHGEQPLWAAMTLAAILGQIGLPGGGIGYGYGGASRVGNVELTFRWPSLPQGKNPVPDFIPVARLADMLDHPGETFEYNGGRYDYPDIRMVWWAGGNPFHHQQDLNKLDRAWRRPEVVIVHEPWWNALARRADIILPCTTTLERNDLGIARSELHLVAMRKAVDPVGEARSDHDILAGIAARLGLGDEFTDGRDEMGWVRHLYDQSREIAGDNGISLPDFETFWEVGQFRQEVPVAPRSMLEEFRADPDGNPLGTPSGRIEIFSERIAGFGYADCPGHAVWLEPDEWLGGEQSVRYPLHLISNQPATRLHSQLDLGATSQASKIAGREPATLNPDDAAARDIRDGDVIRIVNERGACLAGAVLSADVAPGVVQLSTGAWLDQITRGNCAPLDRHGNPNVLTLDKPTSRLSQAPIAHSTLVEVEKWLTPEDVHAFTPPPILAERPAPGNALETS